METFEDHYQGMVNALQKHMPGADMALIDKAVEYADVKHKRQKRKDGSPYIIHPLAVAEIVTEMGLDVDAVLGALLHDCIEDTDASHEEIEKLFGATVAELVEGVTKLTRADFSSSEEAQMENLRKMFMAMSKDIRVVLIKIADRLHNMRTMQYQTPEKQVKKCKETMDIYAPLAHRLGMQKIKWELEDTSLRYLAPDEYNNITSHLQAHKEQDDQFMKTIQDLITERLDSMGIRSTTYGRIKHVYSIYRKMQSQNKTMDELYDIYAFRCIVDSMPDCYNVLGHIHDLFKLVPGRFKDYISTPKPNDYQSLHTTVIGKQGIPFEVQIRTWQMHEIAEYGVAAHWKYKQGSGDGSEKDFEWVRRLLETQQDSDAEEFVQSMKIDMFDDEVFVYTPKGRIVSLPAGSTPIDFAYAIHSGVGNAMVGAKVNHRIANIDSKLKNGDIVEILTSKSAKGPSRDWLSICKSNQARTKIKQWFKREKREENIVHGKSSFESEMKRVGLPLSAITEDTLESQLLKKLSFTCWDDMYAAIGYGGLTATKAVGKIRDDIQRALKAQDTDILPKALRLSQDDSALSRHAVSGIIVEDMDSIMVKFAKCCTPVPGDAIAGFITKGFGVSVHRADCPNAIETKRKPDELDRWVQCSWVESNLPHYKTSLEVASKDRDGLTVDIAMALSACKVKVTALSARSMPDGYAIMNMTLEVKNKEELAAVINKLNNIQGVYQVTRTGGK